MPHPAREERDADDVAARTPPPRPRSSRRRVEMTRGGVDHANLAAAREQRGRDVLQAEQRRPQRSGDGGLTSRTRRHRRASISERRLPRKRRCARLRSCGRSLRGRAAKRQGRAAGRQYVQGVAGAFAPGAAPSATEYAGAMGNRVRPGPRGRARGRRRPGALPLVPAVRPGDPSSPGGGPRRLRASAVSGGGAAESAAEAVVKARKGPPAGSRDRQVPRSRAASRDRRDALTSWAATATIVGSDVNGPICGFWSDADRDAAHGVHAAAGPPPRPKAAVQAKALQGFADAFQQWCAVFPSPACRSGPASRRSRCRGRPPTPGIPMPLVAFSPAPFAADARRQRPERAGGARRRGGGHARGVRARKAGRMVLGLMGMGRTDLAPPLIPVGPVVARHGVSAPPAVI